MMHLDILLNNLGDRPIYDQIFSQLRDQILSGALAPGQALPSIRALARDLRVSVITTKRAYDELEAAGLLTTVPGKGCYVAEADTALLREANLTKIEGHLTEALALAAGCGLTEDDLIRMLHLLNERE